MLQAPGAATTFPARIGMAPDAVPLLLRNTAHCFKRSLAEAAPNAAPAPLAGRVAPLATGFTKAVRQSLHLENAVKNARNPEEVRQIFKDLHAFTEPVGGAENREIQQVRDEIQEKLAFSEGLHGAALEDVNVDIFYLFLKLLLLLNKQQEQERLSRQIERDLQAKYMDKVADNFQTQGKWLLNTCIASGVMSIISATGPILQHSSAGTRLHSMLPDFIKSDTKAEDFFKSIQKMTYAGSEISKNSGQVHSTYSEGWRTRDNFGSEKAKMLGEDETRNREDTKQYFMNLVNAVNQKMQSERELDNQLVR